MSIHFISGKPGGGKSYYATKLVIDELTKGDRDIVTNLPLKLPELNEYVQRIAPQRDCRTIQRVHFIPPEMLQKFYLVRPGCEVVETGGQVHRLVWEPAAPPPVMYVLDEVHTYFNARNWAKNGLEVGYYLSQHRKFGDDVIAISQHLEKVDKQFRLDAQDFTFVRNLGKERLGFFRLPDKRCVAATYFDHTRGAGNNPMMTAHFSIDVEGIATCYDTAAGVGVTGRAADTQEKTKGLSLWWVLVVFAAILAVIFFGPRMFVASQVEKVKANDPGKHPRTNSIPMVRPPAQPSPPPAQASPPPAQIGEQVATPPPARKLVGLVAFSGEPVALFDDGTREPALLVFKDGRIVTESGVHRFGKIEPAPVGPPPAQPVAPLVFTPPAQDRVPRLLRVHHQNGTVTESLQR